MKIIACFALWLILTGVAGAEPQAIIDTDFGVPGKPFETITAAKGVRITGRLPDGWRDNSEWKSNVVAEYKPMSEGGRDFLRVEQTSGDGLSSCTACPHWTTPMQAVVWESLKVPKNMIVCAYKPSRVRAGDQPNYSAYAHKRSYSPILPLRWRVR